MKLFLSSIRLPDQHELAQLFDNKADLSVAIIPNAWDTYPETRQKLELENTVSLFNKSKFRTTVVDLVTMTDKYVEDTIESSDFLWVMGGNAFYLNYLLRKSGCDNKIKRALDNGLVYGGASAGAVITGPTLHGVENVDDPNDAPKVIWDGLGLVDFSIIPHWGTEKYAKKLEKMEEEMRTFSPQIFELDNNQAILELNGIREVHRINP